MYSEIIFAQAILPVRMKAISAIIVTDNRLIIHQK